MDLLKKLAAFLVVAVLFGFFGWWLGPDLRGDFSHRNDAFESVNDAQIVEAKCKSKLFLISFCDVKATGAGVSGGLREFSYFLIGGLGNEGVGLRRSKGGGPVASRYLTTNIGIDYLIRRIGSFAILMGLMGAALVGCFVAIVRSNAPA
jgi:hypothetical protein